MKFLCAIAIFLSSYITYGQFHTGASRSELGLMVGATTYLGDLNQFIPFKRAHLAGGLVYRYNVNARMSVRANFLYGRLSADDGESSEAIYQDRNLNFYTDIFELAAGVEFNYFPFQLGHDRYKGTAYILAEIGMFMMNPKTVYNGDIVELRPIGTEGQGTSLNSKKHYSLTQLCIPLGVGAKLSLGSRVGLNFEVGIRKTFTDYIDDVGANSYVDPEQLAIESGPLAAELSNKSGDRYGKRGNESTKDWYIFAGGMLTFRLGQPTNCFHGN